MPPSVPRRKDVIAAHKSEGGRVAAVFPIHYPRELFRVFDILPVEVWGPPGVSTAEGDAHLQAYTCSIVRGGLSFLLQGGLDVADLLVVPHACDSLQGLGSVLIDFVDTGRPVLTVYNPRGGSHQASVDFLAAELRRLFERLEEITGSAPSETQLLLACEREETADAALGRLLSERRRLPLNDLELYRVIRSREYLPAEVFLEQAEALLETAATGERAGVPLLVSGLVPEPMEVFAAIEAAGGLVVADDFASSGRRVYPRGSLRDPWRRMAERLLGGAPDSTRGSIIADRVAHLKRLCESSGARAVLFFLVKFCEPELFYLPQIRKALEEIGLKSVVIEADVTEALPGQAVTRIEALLETVT